jgi:hypothetical protein
MFILYLDNQLDTWSTAHKINWWLRKEWKNIGYFFQFPHHYNHFGHIIKCTQNIHGTCHYCIYKRNFSRQSSVLKNNFCSSLFMTLYHAIFLLLLNVAAVILQRHLAIPTKTEFKALLSEIFFMNTSRR